MKIFLGGTVGSKWRVELIDLLLPQVSYFNPIVKNWNEVARVTELQQRRRCDINLYVLTAKMKGCYSIAEVVDDSNKKSKRTMLCILDEIGRASCRERV